MTATAAEALELALWLHRVPARRAALLGRPLPDGVGQLLRVAGGAPDQVAAAARITGEDEATILEAVRFYLQQILFHDDADAYRVLGLRPDAPQAKAREHHRLLQQWLHPDRHGDDAWETVYATRINRAWSHLKTPQSRAAYNATQSTLPPCRSRFSGDPPPQPRPTPLPIPHPPHTRSRTLTYLVLLACIGLLLLIALRQERPPQWPDFPSSLAAAPPVPEPELAEVPQLVATLGIARVDPVERPPGTAPQSIQAFPIAQPTIQPAPARAIPVAMTHHRNPRQVTAPREATGPAPVPVAVEQPLPALPAVAPPLETLALAVVDPVVPRPRQAAAPPPIPDAFDRMAQARARARLVTAYLGDAAAAAPPVWNDVDTFHTARTLRAELHQRLGMPHNVELQWLDPKWRLSADGAWLDTGYRAAGEQGRLAIAFGWCEDQWLVRSIGLVPAS